MDNMRLFSMEALQRVAEVGRAAEEEIERRSDADTQVTTPPGWVVEDDRDSEEKMDDERDEIMRGIFG